MKRRHFLSLVAAAGLAGCGRKADVRAPEEEKSAYTFPRPYPAPDSVIPKTVVSPKPEDEAGEETQPRLERKNQDKLSPFPLSPERSQSYGS